MNLTGLREAKIFKGKLSLFTSFFGLGVCLFWDGLENILKPKPMEPGYKDVPEMDWGIF